MNVCIIRYINDINAAAPDTGILIVSSGKSIKNNLYCKHFITFNVTNNNFVFNLVFDEKLLLGNGNKIKNRFKITFLQ